MKRDVDLDELLAARKRLRFETEMVSLIPALTKLSWKLCHNRCDVDDLIQEALCNALKGSHLYNPAFSLKGWLYVVMKNAVIDSHRRKARGTLLLSTEFTTEPITSPS